EMSSANYASRSAATPQGPHGRNVQPGAPGDYATLIENTPIRAKLQPQPGGPEPRVRDLEEHRGQVGAVRFVVEAHGHQGHLVHELEVVVQAPGKHFVIACRQKESRAGEGGGRADQ